MEHVVVFARAPRLGEVKTRLAATAPLSPAECLGLYTAFLEDTVACALASPAAAVTLAFTPAEAEEEVAPLVAAVGGPGHRVACVPQVGPDFDSRFQAAVEEAARRGGTRVVVVGSDAPLLTPHHLAAAFAFLRERGGLVLGPSGEGGTYLVGCRPADGLDFRGAFRDGVELANLAALAGTRGLPLRLLEEVTDVDVQADLITVLSVLQARGAARPHGETWMPRATWASLQALGLAVVRKDGGTREKVLTRQGTTARMAGGR